LQSQIDRRRVMASPHVSIILPTFNRTHYLREAIASVFAQTFRDWELIVADDGSDETTRAFLSGLHDGRVVRLYLSHSGNPGAVRNRAMRAARAPYFAFLDSDDVWAPRKLEIQLDGMRSHPQRRWSYTNDAQIDECGNPLPTNLEPRALYDGWIVEPLLKFQALVATPSVVVDRSLVDEVGAFDEEQRYGEDFDLWVRLALRSEASVSSDTLVYIRNNHTERYSRDRLAAYRAWVRLYGKLARLMPNPELRAVCRQNRGKSAIILAGLYSDHNDRLGVARTVLASAAYSWPYPEWWWDALKAMVRPVVPSELRSIYRRSKAQRKASARAKSSPESASPPDGPKEGGFRGI
jgi:glycosyltransferase involved in cell wall biosynthesis